MAVTEELARSQNPLPLHPNLNDLLTLNDLTRFQKHIVKELLSEDSGPDDFEGLVLDIQSHIAFLKRANWKVTKSEGDMVDRPDHYNRFPLEPTYYAQMADLDWCRGNALKYIFRFPFKNGIEDLRKAGRYITMYVKYLEADPNWSK